MRDIHEKGFSPIYVVLIVVAIGIIGFTGWYVYNSTKKTNDTISSKNDTTVTENAKSKVATGNTVNTEGWNTFTNSTLGVSFKYPKNWSVVADHEQDPTKTDMLLIQSPRGEGPTASNRYALVYFEKVRSLELEPANPKTDLNYNDLKSFYADKLKDDNANTGSIYQITGYKEFDVSGLSFIKRLKIETINSTGSLNPYQMQYQYYYLNRTQPYTVFYSEGIENKDTTDKDQNTSTWQFKDIVDVVVSSIKIN